MATEYALSAEELEAPPVVPEWVLFSCGDRKFGAPLAISREVVPPQPLTRLPGCGPAVAGLMGLRGRVITVFDMGVVLGLSPSRLVEDHRTLVLEHGKRTIGVLVDGIHGIAHGFGAVLSEPPSSMGELDAIRSDVVGVGTQGVITYYALACDRILDRLLADDGVSEG